jgi:hypothetical protein
VPRSGLHLVLCSGRRLVRAVLQAGPSHPVRPAEQPCLRAVYLGAAQLGVPRKVPAVWPLAVSPSMAAAVGRERAIGARFSRALALVHAPAAARRVLPAAAVRWAEASLRVVQHEARQPVAEVAVRPDAVGPAVAVPLDEAVAEVEALRDVAAAVAAEPAAGAGVAAWRVAPARGAAFGGCLGFPSGPSSSLACATTSGAD